jgi:SAM-dependent methyltransferase
MSILNTNAALRDSVRWAYSEAAKNPEAEHPFPTGRALAEELGYPPNLLSSLPAIATEAFAGVSAVAIFAGIPEGATVLDLGCGAGLDALIAARRVGSGGQVIGVDFSQLMLARAQQAATESGTDNVVLLLAGGEQLPLKANAIDVALVNGIFNLNPARGLIFRELARVVRPGGLVFAAELILREALSAEEQTQANWFA